MNTVAKKKVRLVSLLSLSYIFWLPFFSFGQTLPINFPIVEECFRRIQLNKEGALNETSFTIRPICSILPLNYDSLHCLSTLLPGSGSTLIQIGKVKAKPLPIVIKQQYNSHHPYGWNDGSMISAKGYQNQISFGLYSKIGPLSLQIQPEILYAQNKSFRTFESKRLDSVWISYYNMINSIDEPEKHGHDSYAKIFPGQSSVRFNHKKLSLGISTENLWWGPCTRNALIMSNNAPGFEHITFNTISPVNSLVGSFEWQIISGILKNSGIIPADTAFTYQGERLYNPKNNDDRYLNGMIFTWQPKWTKGLFIGMSRVFYLYEDDLQKNLNSYLPIVSNIFKGNKGEIEDAKERDQLLSFFFRLMLPKEKIEVWAEYGKNDHAADLRDLVLEPEHTRAFTFGARKIFKSYKGGEIEFLTEMTNLQSPSTIRLRGQNTWYSHHQVRHGYTNQGQVLGAGIGTGSNSQTIGLNWIKEIDKFGVMLERVVRNNDFYYDAFASTRNFGRHWVDLSLNLNKSWHHKHFIYNADLSLIRSLNYQWRTGKGRDVNNVHAGLSVSYLF